MICNKLSQFVLYQMKRSAMKSNIAMQPRCRPEGRLFPRRKVAAKASFLNGVGDFDMELSLAIKESLKYVQHEKQEVPKENGYVTNDSCKSDNEHDTTIEVANSSDTQRTNKAVNTVNSKPINAAMAAPSADCVTEEVGRLKDLVLSQAELIQCQQEEISKKEKELKSLRAANDALQCRLERMERRMSILKHKEESHDVIGTKSETLPFRTTTNLQSSPHKSQNEMLKLEYRKRRRHKIYFSHKKTHKRQRLLQSHASFKDMSLNNENEESEEVEDEREKYSNSESEGEQGNNSANESVISGSRKEENGARPNEEVEELKEIKTIDYPIMQTESLYHLYYPRHVFPSPDVKKLMEQTEVETPTWRLKPVTNMYQLEGTENITDEAYNKRHQKFEMEEKRRKRWDLQRLRELRVLEKLQRQREDEIRASQDEADVETFLPSVHDLNHIEITQYLPVMAFGQPVPYVSPAEFEIPWEMSSSGQVVPVNRQKASNVPLKKH
ncbi:male-specific lethal 1 homolog [Biomphalaria glabrata]|uniref:Male-specific lethal 1 homolog n=1 Tax=Biomphalaria glabrata TaxID=6526 RepID=A0A9U8EIE8_BIOGL|nr:male-specific lethal 1 homolog [Biomphalaria glabrata]